MTTKQRSSTIESIFGERQNIYFFMHFQFFFSCRIWIQMQRNEFTRKKLRQKSASLFCVNFCHFAARSNACIWSKCEHRFLISVWCECLVIFLSLLISQRGVYLRKSLYVECNQFVLLTLYCIVRLLWFALTTNAENGSEKMISKHCQRYKQKIIENRTKQMISCTCSIAKLKWTHRIEQNCSFSHFHFEWKTNEFFGIIFLIVKSNFFA